MRLDLLQSRWWALSAKCESLPAEARSLQYRADTVESCPEIRLTGLAALLPLSQPQRDKSIKAPFRASARVLRQAKARGGWEVR